METGTTEKEEQLRLFRAVKRLEATKGFYTHVAIYIFMNALMLTTWAIDSFLPNSFYRTSVFVIAVFGGICVLVHAVVFYSNRTRWGSNWEERTLQKFMDRDRPKDKNNTNQK